MEKISFSASVKEALLKSEQKKKCCKKTFLDAEKCLDKGINPRFDVSAVLVRIKCDNCLREFIKAAFIYRGSITDPEKRNHLDFAFSDEIESDAVNSALERAGFFPGRTVRQGKTVLYFKDNDIIGDLLAFIGATKAAFDVMNLKIVKDVRNNANRLVNCDTANIEKAISASQKYLEAIDFITEHGSLDALPAELKEAGELRRDYPQASLSDLALKCHPTITKSGMKHRLEKILAAAAELAERLEIEK